MGRAAKFFSASFFWNYRGYNFGILPEKFLKLGFARPNPLQIFFQIQFTEYIPLLPFPLPA